MGLPTDPNNLLQLRRVDGVTELHGLSQRQHRHEAGVLLKRQPHKAL